MGRHIHVVIHWFLVSNVAPVLPHSQQSIEGVYHSYAECVAQQEPTTRRLEEIFPESIGVVLWCVPIVDQAQVRSPG